MRGVKGWHVEVAVSAAFDVAGSRLAYWPSKRQCGAPRGHYTTQGTVRSPSHGPCGAVLGLLSPRAVAGGWTGEGLTWPGATFCVVPRVGMCSLLVMQVGLGDCNGEGTR